jgi:hypothetical protein
MDAIVSYENTAVNKGHGTSLKQALGELWEKLYPSPRNAG